MPSSIFMYVSAFQRKIIETTVHEEMSRIDGTFIKFLLEDVY